MEIEAAAIQAGAVWGSEDLRARRAELQGRLQGFGKADPYAHLSLGERVALWQREQEKILAPDSYGGPPGLATDRDGAKGPAALE